MLNVYLITVVLYFVLMGIMFVALKGEDREFDEELAEEFDFNTKWFEKLVAISVIVIGFIPLANVALVLVLLFEAFRKRG